MNAAELAEFLKTALPYEGANDRHSWILHIAGQSRHDTTAVPAELFSKLEGGELHYENTWRTYESQKQARNALIDAAILSLLPPERPQQPGFINPLPIIHLWLVSFRHENALDISRSELTAWIAEKFPLTHTALATDSLIAAGIGRQAQQPATVYCTATYNGE